MGLEAQITLNISGKAYQVKALLESSELILRGDYKRKFFVADMKNVTVTGASLLFEVGDEKFSFELGAVRAAVWAKKITAPPPSLAEKLGLKNGGKAFVIGAVHDLELQRALDGRSMTEKSAASHFIAVVQSESELDIALEIYGDARQPIWLVNMKGAKTLLGENAIRERMRARGFKDTKTCSVSSIFTATRYNP